MAEEKKNPVERRVEPRPKELPAGEFSSWLKKTRSAHRLKDGNVDVPCGECTACCRSSMFVHVGPDETRTLARIPKALLFPAPGLPKGHMLMGYDERGRCPMLINDRCSIYEYRPKTCRDYDCRVFAATGIELDEASLASVAEQARRWKFIFSDDQARKEHAAVRATAHYLLEQGHAFPGKALPANPTQLAALAIKVCDVFYRLDEEPNSQGDGHRPPSQMIVRAILEALEKFESGDPGS